MTEKYTKEELRKAYAEACVSQVYSILMRMEKDREYLRQIFEEFHRKKPLPDRDIETFNKKLKGLMLEKWFYKELGVD